MFQALPSQSVALVIHKLQRLEGNNTIDVSSLCFLRRFLFPVNSKDEIKKNLRGEKNETVNYLLTCFKKAI